MFDGLRLANGDLAGSRYFNGRNAPRPGPIGISEKEKSRLQTGGSRRTATEQRHASPLERHPSLHRNLSQILIERDHDPRISFANVDNRRIGQATKIRHHPHEIVTIRSQHINEFFGKFSSASSRIVRPEPDRTSRPAQAHSRSQDTRGYLRG